MADVATSSGAGGGPPPNRNNKRPLPEDKVTDPKKRKRVKKANKVKIKTADHADYMEDILNNLKAKENRAIDWVSVQLRSPNRNARRWDLDLSEATYPNVDLTPYKALMGRQEDDLLMQYTRRDPASTDEDTLLIKTDAIFDSVRFDFWVPGNIRSVQLKEWNNDVRGGPTDQSEFRPFRRIPRTEVAEWDDDQDASSQYTSESRDSETRPQD